MSSTGNEIDWRDTIAAFLHDPPDKALHIAGHESRALKYLSAALGTEVSRQEIKVAADIDASIAERLAMPTAGENKERAVGPENGSLSVVHPLSGEGRTIPVQLLQPDIITECIQRLVQPYESPQRRFFALWRLLPEKLAEIDPAYDSLPADTRIPDHTIWNHLDAAAALSPCDHGGGLALLSFAISPVQEFIAAARSVRDLWSGSMILSWIAFQSMLPVIETCGPSALIYPSLRGLPWVDRLLRKDFGVHITTFPEESSLRVPSLPNRFLAAVPGKNADKLALKCEECGQEAWHRIADKVRSAIERAMSGLPHGASWSKRWDRQIQDYFSFTSSVVHRRQCSEEDLRKLLGKDIAPEARRLADLIPPSHRPSYNQKTAGGWQTLVEYSARLMESRRMVRHVPEGIAADTGAMVPGKCSLMGSLEQMGPEDLSQSAEFWDEAGKISIEGIRVRSGERLCAVSLVKRFSEPAFFAPELGLKPATVADTATVAAAFWLQRAGIDPRSYPNWNGQWLHWPRRDFDPEDEPVPENLWKTINKVRNDKKLGGFPPTYYAVLMMDGDHMGAWLSGDKAPAIRDVLHPRLREYFQKLGPDAEKALDAKRPVGPAMHAAISQALASFSIHIAPAVVSKHHGMLIYSGGDDLLALLPVENALECALELYRSFRGESDYGTDRGYARINGKEILMMGPKATLSAGMAIVHYKSDLRRSLDEARQAEKAAKRGGRNLLVIRTCRRSGEHTEVFCPWSFVPAAQMIESGFISGASDRFAYHLASLRPTLEALHDEVQVCELKRQIGRAEPETRQLLAGTKDKQEAGEKMARYFREYAAALMGSEGFQGKAFGGFIDLLQTTSFLARGRD